MFFLTDRLRVNYFNLIPNLASIAFIMGLQLCFPSYYLSIKLMLFNPYHFHHNGFLHFIADYFPKNFLRGWS